MNINENSLFAGKFEYEKNLSCATPSGNYFWYRKRQEIIKLFKRNINLFINSNAETTSPAKNKLFLDIGCGESIDLFLIRNLFKEYSSNWHFIGLEAAPNSLYISNLKKSYYQVDNLEFLPGDITKKLPFPDAKLDVVYCSEVIEHLIDPEVFLWEIKRITKPNGYLILTTPNEPNLFQRAYWDKKRLQKMQAETQATKEQYQKVNIEDGNVFLYGHVSLRTIKEWENTLEKIGFKNIDYGRGAVTYGGTPFFDNEWILGTRFLLEASLDLLPRRWMYNFSDQLIGLYKLGVSD